jgi:hypothetical protein
VCRSLVCPACHRKTRHRLAAPALAHAPSQPRLRTGAASAEPDDLGDPQIVQSLVTLLIALPPDTPSSIPVGIPRKVQNRAASFLLEWLGAAVGNANPEAGRVGDGLFYHWRMRHAAWLLLRRDQKDAESDPPTAAERSAYLSQVMHRLQLASDGRWNQLIVEATDAVAAVRPRAPPTNGQTYGEWSEWQFLRAATLSLAQGTRAAADVLPGEPAVPPSPELVGEMAELFRTQPPSADERAKRSELLTRISVAPRYAKRKVTASVAARQVDAARPMAGPGPSGLRNSHLSAMRRLPQGPATLAAWAQVWAQGQIAPMLAPIWTD